MIYIHLQLKEYERVIADEFKREAKRNILEARNGDDE